MFRYLRHVDEYESALMESDQFHRPHPTLSLTGEGVVLLHR
jgi:hypothetical protein